MLFSAGEADDVVDGEEIGGVVAALDQRQLMGNRLPDLLRHAVGIAEAGALLGEADQRLLRARRIAGRLVGVVVAELVEGEFEALQHGEGFGDRLGVVAKEPRHLGGVLEVALGILFEQPAGILDRPVLADAGDDVLERPAFGRVVEHVVGGEKRHAVAAGDAVEEGKATPVAGAVEPVRHQPDIAGEGIVEGGEGGGEVFSPPHPPLVPAQAGTQLSHL